MPRTTHVLYWAAALGLASAASFGPPAAAARSSHMAGPARAGLAGAVHAMPLHAFASPVTVKPPLTASTQPNSRRALVQRRRHSFDPRASFGTLPQPITLPPSPALAPIEPLPDPPVLAPLSQPLSTTLSGGGGTSRTTPTTSEAAPSVPGGGGETLADCMSFWDAATHMTKGEWRSTCMRAKAGYDDLTVHAAATGDRTVHRRVASHSKSVGHAP